MVKSDELIKFITEKMITRLTTPKEERDSRSGRVPDHEGWKTRWFGMLPAALGMIIRDIRKRAERKKSPPPK